MKQRLLGDGAKLETSWLVKGPATAPVKPSLSPTAHLPHCLQVSIYTAPLPARVYCLSERLSTGAFFKSHQLWPQHWSDGAI